MRMVVGWRRDHAGSQPLNMNIGPSLANELRITPSVDFGNVSVVLSISRDITHAGSRSRSIHDTALQHVGGRANGCCNRSLKASSSKNTS
jgi:hypothetical protein